MAAFFCCHKALVLVAKCNQSNSNLINLLRCNQLGPDGASTTMVAHAFKASCFCCKCPIAGMWAEAESLDDEQDIAIRASSNSTAGL
jgi:hypothetical protein